MWKILLLLHSAKTRDAISESATSFFTVCTLSLPRPILARELGVAAELPIKSPLPLFALELLTFLQRPQLRRPLRHQFQRLRPRQ
jgi:hypothetical protein